MISEVIKIKTLLNKSKMKGFIKVTDTSERVHFLNVRYIIKFTPTNQNFVGNTIITTSLETIQTTTTPEEIVDMIQLSNE